MARIITGTDILTDPQSQHINLLKQVIDKRIGQPRPVREQPNEKMILEAMMCSATDIAFIVTDVHCRILHSNKTAEKLFDYSLEEAKAIRIHNILQLPKEWNGKQSIDPVVEQIGKQGAFSITFKKESDDITTYIEINIIGIKGADKEIQGYVLTAKDISEKIELSKRLKNRSEELEETNAALRAILRQKKADKEEMGREVRQNIENTVLPFFNQLRRGTTIPAHEDIIQAIENNLKKISSPCSSQISNLYANLSPAETQVANLIKDGHSSKEIASILNISPKTVYTHRRNIRKKSGINNQRVNLQSIFQQIET